MRISLSKTWFRSFHTLDSVYPDLYSNPRLVKRALTFAEGIPTKFNYNLALLSSPKVETMYALNPRNTIIIKDGQKNLRSAIIHELAHHVWHRIIDDVDKVQVMKICQTNNTDANEQFASTAEYFLTGHCARFESKDSKVSQALASDIKPILARYFDL